MRVLGLEAIDIGLLHRPALDRRAVVGAPAAAARDIEALGLSIANLYWLFGGSPHERPLSDPQAHAAHRAEFPAIVEFASALAIPTIFVLPGVMHPQVSRDGSLEASATVLRDLVEMAATRDVTLTVEPHVGGILDSPTRTFQLLDMVPGLRLTLDYGHFVCMGFTQEAIDPLVPQAAHVHMRQARPGALQSKWAEGTIDFAAIVERLAAAGYGGYLSLEAVHQAYMNTLFDDVLTETIAMRDALRGLGVR